MQNHALEVGDKGKYNGVDVTITGFIDPITIAVYGPLGKRWSWVKMPHRNRLLALLGFKQECTVWEEYETTRNISFWSFKKI